MHAGNLRPTEDFDPRQNIVVADTVDRETRSRIMSRVRSKNTNIELRVRNAIHAKGFRYRLHVNGLPGSPDLVFPRYKMVVFVHGCFWHSHGCKRSRKPTTNQEYWSRKLNRNINRDIYVIQQLGNLGWRCSVVWECQLNEGIAKVLSELEKNRLAQNVLLKQS